MSVNSPATARTAALSGKFTRSVGLVEKTLGNNADKLHQNRSVAYSVALVLLNRNRRFAQTHRTIRAGYDSGTDSDDSRKQAAMLCFAQYSRSFVHFMDVLRTCANHTLRESPVNLLSALLPNAISSAGELPRQCREQRHLLRIGAWRLADTVELSAEIDVKVVVHHFEDGSNHKPPFRFADSDQFRMAKHTREARRLFFRRLSRPDTFCRLFHPLEHLHCLFDPAFTRRLTFNRFHIFDVTRIFVFRLVRL